MKNHFNTRKIALVGIIISTASFNAIAKADWHYARSFDYIHQQDSLTIAQFLQQAAITGMKEVLTGKLAAEKAADIKIKAFGQMMVDDHTKANEELRALAKLKKVDLPMSRPGGGQRPDGRVDSSPENMRDTSRIKNAGGEAGNNGQAKKNANGVTEADVTNAIEKLNNLTGASFDKAYVGMMVTDHQNAVSLFEKASQSTDTAVKAYANKYLPALKKHLRQVNALAVR